MQSGLNIVFDQLIKWFKSNSLFLNFDKTYFIQFCSIYSVTFNIFTFTGRTDE